MIAYLAQLLWLLFFLIFCLLNAPFWLLWLAVGIFLFQSKMMCIGYVWNTYYWGKRSA